MPTSPNSRAGGGDKQRPGETSSAASSPDGSTVLGGQSKNQRRNLRQRLRATLAKVREDAQLAGAIDTIPQGAVEATNRVKEKVDPTTQGEKEQLKLIETAIRSGWAVPEEIKPELVAEMTAIVTDDSEDTSDKTKVAAFRALLAADQAQHERDNPQIKNKSGVVNVSVQTNIAAVDVLRATLRQDTPQSLPQIEDNK